MVIVNYIFTFSILDKQDSKGEIMQDLLKLIFEFWEIICIVSVIITVIAIFQSNKKEGKSKIIFVFFEYAFLLILLIAALINLLCTKVPNVVEYDYNLALYSLRNNNLEVQIKEGYTADSYDKILAQNIDPDTIVKKGTIIELTTNNKVETEKVDSKMVKVPNVVGMSQVQGAVELAKSGLHFRTESDLSNNFCNGFYVSKQSIEEGTEVPFGTVVTITISNK